MIQPADRRMAMPPRDLVELADRLRRVDLPRHTARLRLGERVAQQALGAGIDLRRHHHAEQAARRMLLGALDQRQRLAHRLFARRLVPGIFDHMAVLRVPAPRTEHRRDAHTHAGLRQQIEPSRMRHRQIGQRGHARQQQLRQRHAYAMRDRLRVGTEDRQVLVERGIIETRTADFVDQPLVHRLARRMRVDVHQPRHHHHAGAGYHFIRLPIVAAADEAQHAAIERHIGIRHIDVRLRARVPGHHHVGVADKRERHQLR